MIIQALQDKVRAWLGKSLMPTSSKASDLLSQYEWENFSFHHLANWLSDRYKTQVMFIPFRPSAELFGLWFRTEGGNQYFLYSERLGELHQIQVVLHEVAHWLLGHDTMCLSHADLQRIAAGEPLALSGLHLVRQRAANNHDQEEQQAESLAINMLARVLAERRPDVVDPNLVQYMDEWETRYGTHSN